MTISKRTSVRHAFITALTGLATTGDRVFESRTRPLEAAELPALLVFSGEMEPQGVYAGGQPVGYTYKLRADVLVKEKGGAEQVGDTIIEEMKAALFATPQTLTLGGLALAVRLVGVGEVDLDDSAEKPALRIPVLFEVTFA